MASTKPPPAVEADMHLIDLTAMAGSECRFCVECGQVIVRNHVERTDEMIDFDVELACGLRDFDEFFKDDYGTSHESLLQIFTPETAIADREETEASMPRGLLDSAVPSELPDPLAPWGMRRPLDLLTGLELGLTLPEAEILKPSKYVPVGILIDIEDEEESLALEEAEEILRFIFPELKILPTEEKSTDKCEPIQDELPTAVPAADLEPKPKKKKKKKKNKVPAAIPIPAQESLKPQLDASMIPKRADISKAGERGAKTQVLVNMLAIRLLGDDPQPRRLARYHVSYEPSKSTSLIDKAYEAAKARLFPDRNTAYSANGLLYCAGCLPIESPLELTVKVKEHDDDDDDDDDEEIDVKVTICKVKRPDDDALDLSWMRDVQASSPRRMKASKTALQSIMNSLATKRSVRVKGMYFVPPEDGSTCLDGSLQLWSGLFQSVTIGWKPFLKVDVVHRGFLRDVNVIEYVESIIVQRTNVLTFHDIEANWDLITERLVDLHVTVACNGETRRRQLVVGLVEKRACDMVCPDADGRTTLGLVDYFLAVKNYAIGRPDLPCLRVGDKRGGYFYVPMELCTIEGEASSYKLSENQLEKLREAEEIDANERRRKILQVFNAVNKEDDACLENFGLSVDREFERVDARVLDPPNLHFHQNCQAVTPSNGAWNVESFRSPSDRLQRDFSWTILNLSDAGAHNIFLFSLMFRQEALKLGLPIGEPRLPFSGISSQSDAKYIASCLRELKDKFHVQFVIAVIPDGRRKLYCAIKQSAELKVGLLTQCLRSTTIERDGRLECSEETVRNILMKVNAKLNGVNYTFVSELSRPSCLRETCMIAGADVTHPRSFNEPSIAALVATHDPDTHFQYNVELRFQPPNAEIMHDLESMMREQLLNFYARSRRKPARIILYRDGVGEGEFARVLNEELLAIRRACLSLEATYEPAITVVIVQKRTNTRLFPVEEVDNVRVGTVVDTVVTHPTDLDFLLLSHDPMGDDVRPTKYSCVWDDSGMSVDELEQLTFYLCHMFARCSRSVRYPAPTYYAHIAAARARSLTEGVYVDLRDLPNEQAKLKVHNDLVAQSPMYFL